MVGVCGCLDGDYVVPLLSCDDFGGLGGVGQKREGGDEAQALRAFWIGRAFEFFENDRGGHALVVVRRLVRRTARPTVPWLAGPCMRLYRTPVRGSGSV